MIDQEEIIRQDRIVYLRRDYMSCLKCATQTDSKKEDAYLKQEAAKALKELRELCDHQQSVCLNSEYDGSYLNDYSDHHAEHRICLCCGEQEGAYDGKWLKLKTQPFARFEGKYPDQIKYPLNYLLTDAVQIAEKEGWHYSGRAVKLW
jgi:hypothetical protein